MPACITWEQRKDPIKLTAEFGRARWTQQMTHNKLLWYKGKGKVDLVLNQLSIMPWRWMGEWRCISSILDLSTIWRWVVSFTPQPLYLWEEEPMVPIWQVAEWASELVLSGHCGVEKNFLPLPGM
jgi:hypothetical protein